MKEPEGYVGDWRAAGTHRGTWARAAIVVSSVAFSLSVALLLMQIARTGPMAANAAGIACLSLSLSFPFAARLDAPRLIDLVLAFLVAYGANGLLLAVLLHSAGASALVAQLVAITAFVGLFLILCELFVLSDRGSQLLHRFVVPLVERPRLVRLGFVAALAPSLAYIAARTVLLDYNANDFRYYWLAGDLWRQGLNPYDANVFVAHGAKVFHAGRNNPALWFYPPWFWVISRTVAMFPFAMAQTAWRLLLAAMLLGSVLLFGGRITRNSAREGLQPGAVWYCIAMLFFACTMRASVESLALGQMSHLVLLGLMLALVALLEERQWTGVAAMVVLAMKPQFGLIVGLLKTGTLSRFRILAIAGITIALLALPPILVTGAEPAIGGFLKELTAYAAYDGTTLNEAVGMTGLRHLVFQLTGVELNPMALALVGGVIVLGIGFLLYRKAQGTAERGRILGLALLVMANFVPLHTYETVYVVPVMLLMIGWPALVQLSIGFGLLILYRSEMIADATGWWDPRSFFHGTTIDSVGFLFLLLVWVAAMARDHMAKRPDTMERARPGWRSEVVDREATS